MMSESFPALPFPSGEAATARLSTAIDVEPLLTDLHVFQDRRWDHQRPYSNGVVGSPISAGWTCLPLHSPGGSLERTDPGGPATVPFGPTPALAQMPAFARLVDTLPCELRSVRLLALDPGAELEEHRDKFIGFEYGQLRLHVPLVTNTGAVMYMADKAHHWRPGELWYANFGLPHSVRNDGADRRIHFVADCMVTDALVDLFPDRFRQELRKFSYVRNRPALASAPPPPPVTFLLPAAMKSDLIADIPRDVDASTDGIPASVTVEGPNVVLRTDTGVECHLIAVDAHEYRFQGWLDERTLSFEELPDRVLLNDRRNWTTHVVKCPVVRLG